MLAIDVGIHIFCFPHFLPSHPSSHLIYLASEGLPTTANKLQITSMAPLIKTTIQFLLSFGDIRTPAHLGSATNPACHESQDSISIAESGNIPSISAISCRYHRDQTVL